MYITATCTGKTISLMRQAAPGCYNFFKQEATKTKQNKTFPHQYVLDSSGH